MIHNVYSCTRGPRAPTLNCSISVDLISAPGVPGSEIFCMWEVYEGIISMRAYFEIHLVTEGGGFAIARNTVHNASVKSAWRPSNGDRYMYVQNIPHVRCFREFSLSRQI